MNEAFVTAVLCIDGRYRRCLVEWLSDHYHADYVDLVTEPGPELVLTDEFSDAAASVRRRVDVSIRAHDSKAIAIVGHDDCAGNPVDRETHRSQIERRRSLTRLAPAPSHPRRLRRHSLSNLRRRRRRSKSCAYNQLAV